MKATYLKVDSYPCTKESVLNMPENIESLSKQELSVIDNLKVGESIEVGMFIKIEGISNKEYSQATE